jgi:hypothetical protein
MRYITATIGAIFIFAAVNVVCFVVNSYLPPALQAAVLFLNLGAVTIWCTPALLVGMVLGVFAAASSFRSTLKRYELKAGEKSRANQQLPPPSNGPTAV